MQSTADYLSTAQYGPPHGAYDEMYLPDGTPRPHWRYLAPALLALGPHELERRADEVRRLVREHGVSYHVYGEPEGSIRPWELDPIPFVMSSQEWAGIESGLVQRAEVLNLVLKDLYGPRDLIRKGLLPLELIYGHGGFLRPCAGAGFHSAHPLVLYAADLGRAPDGRFQVMSDRTQSPSGVGYALANRMIVSRCLPSLFRDAQVHRLSLFFQGFRMALAGLCPDRGGAPNNEPRIVLLTPGPLNETYFEQAYLAGYLGFTLAQGEDLTVHSGRVWLRALQGLEPVDVILRRVDDHYCDPVELWPESRLGVPGLFEAVRRGTVAVANPLGSSVLENPGLNCFLPRIARHFLGQDLDLPSVMTWWCGEPGGRSHVLARLCDLVIKPIYREFGSRPVFGPLLSARERDAWADRIRARPFAYVGQEVLHPSASPTWVDARILACQTALRSFLVARPDGYVAMPGGLARAAPDRGPCLISNQAGAIGKDTWVLASEPGQQVSLWTPETRAAVAPTLRVLPSNAANNLFWLGRYTERAEGTLRLLRTALEVWSGSPDYGDDERLACAGELLGVLTRTTVPGPVPPLAEVSNVVEAVFGPEGYGGLTHDLNAALQSAQSVRDRIDEDALRVLYEIPEQHRSAIRPHAHRTPTPRCADHGPGRVFRDPHRDHDPGPELRFLRDRPAPGARAGALHHTAGHAPARPFARTRGPPARGHAAGPGEPHHLPAPLPAGARSGRGAEALDHGPGSSARARLPASVPAGPPGVPAETRGWPVRQRARPDPGGRQRGEPGGYRLPLGRMRYGGPAPLAGPGAVRGRAPAPAVLGRADGQVLGRYLCSTAPSGR